MSVSSEPSSAPARSRAATRQRLVASGVRLFATRGLHGVTTHDIASAASVASGTFYLHFRGKEALFREIAFDAAERLRERLRRATEGAGDLQRAVRGRAAEVVSFTEENRDLVRILFGRDATSAGIAAEVLDHLADDLVARVRQRKEAGRAPADLDPEVAAQALVGMFTRVVTWWAEAPERAARHVVIDTLTRIQLSGVHHLPGPAPEEEPDG